MESHGFEVQRHYLLETAWRADFSHGKGGRTLGVNSEMDGTCSAHLHTTSKFTVLKALPGIGHACGHNLIATCGVGVALAVKAALVKFDIPGKVFLLGTPGEYFRCAP
jgi:metal-dependent amidase/aminoacylase/carboxypeptidase family protein